MKPITLFAMLMFVTFHLACTPAPPIVEEPGVDLAEAEGDFQPLAQDQERPIVIQPGQVEAPNEGISQQTGEEQPPAEDLSGPDRPGVTQGYRVQIFLSDDLREASRIMAEARGRFEDEVYLEYDAPYYKVRVGDCQTEREGQQLLKIAQRLGYAEAWLVTTVISVTEEPDLE